MTNPALDMLVAAHRAFRRDLKDLLRIAGSEAVLPAEAKAEVVAAWSVFSANLHHHHEVEDAALWPRMRALSDAAEVVAAMEKEHRELEALLAQADGEIPAAGDVRVALRALIPRVSEHLDLHLDHEEQDALPIAERGFSPEDWAAISEAARRAFSPEETQVFFPWLLDGCSEADRAALVAVLPPPVRALAESQWEAAYRNRNGWRLAS